MGPNIHVVYQSLSYRFTLIHLDIDDLVRSKQHGYIRILKSQIQANAKLAQLDKHETEITDVTSSVITGGNIWLLICFVSSQFCMFVNDPTTRFLTRTLADRDIKKWFRCVCTPPCVMENCASQNATPRFTDIEHFFYIISSYLVRLCCIFSFKLGVVIDI